eukprot:86399_1
MIMAFQHSEQPTEIAPSAPPEEHLYPQLNNNKTIPPGTNLDENINNNIEKNEEKKLESEDIESYEMCEGISSMNNINFIELQPEGDILSPKICNNKCIPSFIPNNNDEKLDTDTIIKTLNDSIGLFKSKQKRINAFTDMVLSTNKKQRQLIKQQYETKYKYSLSKTIEKQFKGTMRELLLFLMMSENEFIVKWIELSIKKKDINLLTLIICTQTNETLQIVCKLFDSQNNKTMVATIDGLTSNIFHKRNINIFLLKLLDGKRNNDNDKIDMNIVENDVKHLLNASKSKKELNKETYINIFTQRSFQHLYFVAKLFENKIETKCSLIDTVKALFKESSETGYAICVVLYFATRKFELFSNCLAQGIHEPGPYYVMFLRIIVERVEIDFTNIIQLYGVNALKNFIQLDIKPKDNNAANIINKLCGF